MDRMNRFFILNFPSIFRYLSIWGLCRLRQCDIVLRIYYPHHLGVRLGLFALSTFMVSNKWIRQIDAYAHQMVIDIMPLRVRWGAKEEERFHTSHWCVFLYLSKCYLHKWYWSVRKKSKQEWDGIEMSSYIDRLEYNKNESADFHT